MFRLVLAFLVMLQHIGINLSPPDLAYYSAVWQPGTVGVVTFLFLSAFIILDVASSHYMGHPMRFIANRALRILPDFLIALVVAILIQFYLFKFGNPANAYFYPQSEEAFSLRNILLNLVSLVPTPSSPMSWDFVYTIWTVRYEIVFYLIVFAILASVNLLPAALRPALFERTVLAGSVAVVAFTLLAPIEGTHAFMATIFSFIAIGALYYLCREGKTLGEHPALLVFGVVLAALTYLLLEYTKSPLSTAITLCAILIALGLLELRIINSRLAKIDHVCGDLSYTVFLLHLQVATLAKNFLGASFAALAVAMIGSIVLSLLVSITVRRITAPLRNTIRGHALLGELSSPTRLRSKAPPARKLRAH